MCLLAFALGVHPRHDLVLVANRDEEHARPTAPLAIFDGDRIAGGRDLRKGGTWLGVARSRRLAATTNFRGGVAPASPRSRGQLLLDFLTSDDPTLAFATRTAVEAHDYAPFNLLVFDERAGAYASDDPRLDRAVAPGIHGISNARLDEPWPKVTGLVADLEAALQADAPSIDELFAALGSRTIAPDAALPSTGVPLPIERALSARFIVSPVYGTRSSTVVLVDWSTEARMIERTFLPDGTLAAETSLTLRFDPR